VVKVWLARWSCQANKEDSCEIFLHVVIFDIILRIIFFKRLGYG